MVSFHGLDGELGQALSGKMAYVTISNSDLIREIKQVSRTHLCDIYFVDEFSTLTISFKLLSI